MKLSKFSIRNGLADKNVFQEKAASQALRNRICNLFYREDIAKAAKSRIAGSFKNQQVIEDIVLDKLGFIIPKSKISTENYKLTEINNHILSCQWFEVYDFIEIHLLSISEEKRKERVQQYNLIFEEEGVPYRISDGVVVPIYNETELSVIEQASNTEFDSVNQHLKKALLCFSDRKQPDYENTIKESISAVEAMCCIINGKNETLNKALDHLQNNGVHIHPAMKNAFVSLYAYTCDEKGIRHAGIEFVNTPSEDAKYMLISCSAFVNYLIEKWTKTNKAEEGEM